LLQHSSDLSFSSIFHTSFVFLYFSNLSFQIFLQSFVVTVAFLMIMLHLFPTLTSLPEKNNMYLILIVAYSVYPSSKITWSSTAAAV
jgi:hypothetical protein